MNNSPQRFGDEQNFWCPPEERHSRSSSLGMRARGGTKGDGFLKASPQLAPSLLSRGARG